jgi:nitrogen-specific signal transduction histidine kinase
MKPSSTGRLLIVGKTIAGSEGLDRSVLDLGYEVVAVVDDAAEACARAEESDLVLLDLHLGGPDGGVTVSRMLREVHHLPVVMVAPRDDAGEAASTARESDYGCVQFPVSARELRFVLRNALLRGQVEVELRRLERHRIAAQKAESLGAMSRQLMHDFNNLLQGMLGNVQLAALDLPSGSRTKASLDRAVEAGMRAAGLCREFQACASTAVAPVSELSTVVSESRALLRAVVRKGVDIECQLAAGLPHLDINASDVRQILFNLALNASEAIGQHRGRLRISTGRRWLRPRDFASMTAAPERPEGEYVFLELADDGEGITPEVAGRMFEPFFSTRFNGRGLGLTAVLDLVNLHQGAIEVTAAQPRGSVFRIHLPAPRTRAAG